MNRTFATLLGKFAFRLAALTMFVALSGVVSATWAADDGTWYDIAAPGRRFYHATVYDPVRNRLLSFGGSSYSLHNSIWELPLDGTPFWRRLDPAGTPPSPRFYPAAIYDPMRDRLVVFGGYDGADQLNDVWALTLSGTPTWVPLAPLGPAPRRRMGHRVTYDPVRERMLVFGGYIHDGSYANDVWALGLAGDPTWTQITPSGTPPDVRASCALVYDSGRDQMVLFGGAKLGERFDDVWALSLAGDMPVWNELVPGGPGPSARELLDRSSATRALRHPVGLVRHFFGAVAEAEGATVRASYPPEKLDARARPGGLSAEKVSLSIGSYTAFPFQQPKRRNNQCG